jgi:hypothetical protein
MNNEEIAPVSRGEGAPAPTPGCLAGEAHFKRAGRIVTLPPFPARAATRDARSASRRPDAGRGRGEVREV